MLHIKKLPWSLSGPAPSACLHNRLFQPFLDPFKLGLSQMNDSLPCHHDNRKTLKTAQIPLIPFCSDWDGTARTQQTLSLFTAQVSSKQPPLSKSCNHFIVSGKSANPTNIMHCTSYRLAAIVHGNSRDPLHGWQIDSATALRPRLPRCLCALCKHGTPWDPMWLLSQCQNKQRLPYNRDSGIEEQSSLCLCQSNHQGPLFSKPLS